MYSTEYFRRCMKKGKIKKSKTVKKRGKKDDGGDEWRRPLHVYFGHLFAF